MERAHGYRARSISAAHKRTIKEYGGKHVVNYVGIDLGTTYSVVAYVNAQGKPEVIPNEFGRTITPSVVYFGDGNPVVGDDAKERQEHGSEEVASFFKRSMGDEYFLLSFHGQDYNPVR